MYTEYQKRTGSLPNSLTEKLARVHSRVSSIRIYKYIIIFNETNLCLSHPLHSITRVWKSSFWFTAASNWHHIDNNCTYSCVHKRVSQPFSLMFQLDHSLKLRMPLISIWWLFFLFLLNNIILCINYTLQ